MFVHITKLIDSIHKAVVIAVAVVVVVVIHVNHSVLELWCYINSEGFVDNKTLQLIDKVSYH